MVNRELTVVTGAGTGIGRALSHGLAQAGYHVLGVGRRLEPLETTRSAYPNHIRIVAADVSLPEGRAAIVQAVDGKVRFLVHNAAVLGPVDRLENISLNDWRSHMAINVEGPLFLSQALMGSFFEGSRILHISSGAAHGPYKGWGAYCTSKSALHMIYRCLDLEWKEKGIRVGSVRPGVVDTPMQDNVRQAQSDVFPDLPRFIDLKESGSLASPERVAAWLVDILTKTDDEQFSGKELDFRDFGSSA